MAARGWDDRERGVAANRYKVSFGGDGKVLELNRGGSCTTA